MVSSFFFTSSAPTIIPLMLLIAICFVFYFYTSLRFLHENKRTAVASSFPSSPLLSSMSLNRKYHVFSSFHGEDVRKSFLSHLLKEFRDKAIDIFIDNYDIKRGKSIGLELTEAIRGSKIAIVILSKNYASSSWCLDELVEIIKCREEHGRTVMTIFYKVEPTDVKKQTGDFGKAFIKTCKYKSKEDIARWTHALAEVAKIAGYSSTCDSEAVMIQKISSDVSNKVNSSAPSSDWEGLVGMENHMEKLKKSLSLGVSDVRRIGIWGPPGIGKTTIARYLYSQHADRFALSVFMKNVKGYTRPSCSDDHNLKLDLQQQFLSQMFNQKDIEIPRLGVVQDRLKDKKVLVVLDDVDGLFQLDALAKENQWFGPGSRIIITTKNVGLLKAHEMDHIYKVDFPTPREAYQIFCMNAFCQNSPRDGFEELVWDVMYLEGIHPSGIKTAGSYFRGKSKQEYIHELVRSSSKRKPQNGVRIQNIKQKILSSTVSALKKKQIVPVEEEADPEDSTMKKSSSTGLRIKNTKQKILSHVLSAIQKNQIAAAEAEAAKVYKSRRKKDEY